MVKPYLLLLGCTPHLHFRGDRGVFDDVFVTWRDTLLDVYIGRLAKNIAGDISPLGTVQSLT